MNKSLKISQLKSLFMINFSWKRCIQVCLLFFLMNLMIFTLYSEDFLSIMTSVDLPEGFNINLAEGFISWVGFIIGGIWWIFYGIITIIKSSTIVSKDITEKTIDIYLTTPIKRSDYILSKHLSLVTTIIFYVVFSFIGILMVILINDAVTFEDINFERVIFTYIWLTIVLITLESICLMISCLSKPKDAMTYAMMVIFFSFFISIIWNDLDENMQFIKYFSIFTYYQPNDYLYHGLSKDILPDLLILILISISVILITIKKFNTKDILV